MNIHGANVLVTGANRGLGAAIVAELLTAGASTIWAAARDIASLDGAVAAGQGRVKPLPLDITDDEQVAAAVETIGGELDVLINNAGVASTGGTLVATLDEAERIMATNYLGTLRMSRAFVPILRERENAAIVNVLSLLALAPTPRLGVYAATKAAMRSATLSMRAELADTGISVVEILPGLIDTDMTAELDMAKAAPADVAAALVAGLAAGESTIAPDQTSAAGRETWTTDPHALEAFLALV